MGFITHKNEKGGVLLVLVNIQDDMIELQKLGLLDKLLIDKTTRRHILWGTNAYREYGERYAKYCEIFVTLVLFNNLDVIKTRARRNFEQQVGRTKLHGEVATPLWVCNKMIDAIDCDWLGIEHLPKDIWQHIDILFQQTKKSWKKYVDNKRMEIACGEAPYLIQRYDGTNGTMIPVEERTGILDRKLHVVSAFATTPEKWIHWAIRAVEATFGYEYQGDNLLIARVNVTKTFIEFYIHKWNEIPNIKLLNQLLTKITWNLWQMDGLTDTIPCHMDSIEEPSLFDEQNIKINIQPLCKIYDWRNLKKSILFSAMKGRQTGMKFDYVIGNPPYQEAASKSNPRQEPIYPFFYDAVKEVTKKYLLISPARFLFNAGLTSKKWNKKMLSDKHLKVKRYIPDASRIFPNTDIKGGVAIVYRDSTINFGAIEEFIPNEKLRDIAQKVREKEEPSLMENMHAGRSELIFNSLAIKKYPQITSDRLKAIQRKNPQVTKLAPKEEFEIKTSSFDVTPYIFNTSDVLNCQARYHILGLSKQKRIWNWIEAKYVIPRNQLDNNLNFYKLFIPKASGRGTFGETLSNVFIGKPGDSSTPTFLSIGKLRTLHEAQNAKKYVCTKFVRALLGILKITQDNIPAKWKYVPLQDFTNNSDIDWSQSIHDIDQQLYKKYKLTQEEINFIETNVKEMK